jgi:hypothetical protein
MKTSARRSCASSHSVQKFRFDFGYSWYWLDSATDRFAGANNARDATGASGSFIGHEFDIRTRWQINKKVETTLGYARFPARRLRPSAKSAAAIRTSRISR